MKRNTLKVFKALKELDVDKMFDYGDLQVNDIPPSVEVLHCSYQFLLDYKDAKLTLSDSVKRASLDNVYYLKIRIMDQIDSSCIPTEVPSNLGFRNLQALQVQLYLKTAQRHDAFRFINRSIIAQNSNLTSLYICFAFLAQYL